MGRNSWRLNSLITDSEAENCECSIQFQQAFGRKDPVLWVDGGASDALEHDCNKTSDHHGNVPLAKSIFGLAIAADFFIFLFFLGGGGICEMDENRYFGLFSSVEVHLFLIFITSRLRRLLGENCS